jgi:hypothetical protein
MLAVVMAAGLTVAGPVLPAYAADGLTLSSADYGCESLRTGYSTGSWITLNSADAPATVTAVTATSEICQSRAKLSR